MNQRIATADQNIAGYVPLLMFAARDHGVHDLMQDRGRDASTSMHRARAGYLLIPVECRTTCYPKNILES